ncbi:MAG: hypothetical protein C4B59_00700 [Candidatus Methanogaster sp.]|uniref:Uncharacterized protein n=1 Tax=Candidatus Methanogaster sp. TaxID=3386292 RepID=A0AC61L702_9EURY|nr:MAG: hypothetical protein C4B59_00700 [ANME-2 cluster archaeon]
MESGSQTTRYGLAGAVWSEDVSRTKRVASHIRAGTVWIDTYHGAPKYAPFGRYSREQDWQGTWDAWSQELPRSEA